MKNARIDLFWPSYCGKEIQEAIKKLFPEDMSNRWIGEGPKVKEFEKAFAEKFGYKYCIALSSCSAALELAYHMLNIGKGDRVIVPVLTCSATNIPLIRRGANIIFADVKDNLTIDPIDVKRKITKSTKAIVVTTLGGISIDEELFAIARKHYIPVVIDAAQSLGISEEYGEYVCYSLQAIKHFTSGDGGFLIIRNKYKYSRAKRLRWFGIDREAKIKANWQPYQNREMTMDIEEAGYKFQMNDITASIGLVNLKHSDEWLEHRKNIASYYDTHLKCQTISGGSYWLYGIVVDSRDEVAKKLMDKGIETNMAHIRNDVFTVFGGKRLNLPNMNSIENNYLYIPINTRMTIEDAKYIVDVLNTIV